MPYYGSCKRVFMAGTGLLGVMVGLKNCYHNELKTQCWINIEPTLDQHLVFDGITHFQRPCVRTLRLSYITLHYYATPGETCKGSPGVAW